MVKKFHYLQIVDDRPQDPLRKKCMASVRAVVRGEIDEYEIVQIPWIDDPIQRVVLTEKIRFEKAKQHKDLCYVDTDCFVHHAFTPPDDDQPYFAEYSFNYSDPGIPDIYYFYVNGCSDYFVKHFSRPHTNQQTYSVDMQILRGLTHFGLIPDEGFIHCYMTMHNVFSTPQQQSYSIDDFELTALKKHVELMVLEMKSFDELRKK